MLTVYSCTKLAEARAYHHRLAGLGVSPMVNAVLLIAAGASMIFGPLIGFFDCYYDMKNHMLATTIFTVGEIIYIYLLTYLVASNRTQFPQSAQSSINLCVYQLYLVAINGVLMYLGPEWTGISIHQIGEWFAFFSDFYIRW